MSRKGDPDRHYPQHDTTWAGRDLHPALFARRVEYGTPPERKIVPGMFLSLRYPLAATQIEPNRAFVCFCLHTNSPWPAAASMVGQKVPLSPPRTPPTKGARSGCARGLGREFESRRSP